MVTEVHRKIKVSGLSVEVVRKSIKNLHLGVYPPNGRVRVAAPLSVSDDAIRLAVIGKLGWIRRQREKFEAQPRQSKREMVSGESHYFQGRRYRIRVAYHDGPATVALRNKTTMVITVRPETSAEQRLRIVERWYREQLKAEIPALLAKWQPLLDVQVAAWGIKKMKTKWGSCSIDAGRIWLNLELAKKLPQCLEYILVHEMIHLMERHHNDRFTALMDRHLPHWRSYREELNRAPLGHENWSH
ncbi:M48 family metallopeptidase [Paraburkholderia sp. MM6662-R1]|uniref:M48 family metallopeptidase n=1 Tax=Paraburkholderia sp. MM6662-R1 TaxID=2991066 RepID=UPI003D2214C9